MSIPEQPLITVVIPTRDRPKLLMRAVRSALAQTYTNLEVVVVVDGSDPLTTLTLPRITDPRLRWTTLPVPMGGSAARNAGVALARGEWIAFLDDDDEWFPSKLELQIQMALAFQNQQPPEKHATAQQVVVACRMLRHGRAGTFSCPRRLPNPGESLSDYLFVRSGWFTGEGQIQTSMLLAPTALVQKLPFTEGLARHQDTDWYLRVAVQPEVRFIFAEQILGIWHIDGSRASTSTSHNWKATLQWFRGMRELISPRAYSGFIASQLASEAAAQGKFSAFLPLLRELLSGSPRMHDLLLFLLIWIVPPGARSRLRKTRHSVAPFFKKPLGKMPSPALEVPR